VCARALDLRFPEAVDAAVNKALKPYRKALHNGALESGSAGNAQTFLVHLRMSHGMSVSKRHCRGDGILQKMYSVENGHMHILLLKGTDRLGIAKGLVLTPSKFREVAPLAATLS
jgi:hypothetical protein